jgi:polyphosphate kinase
MTPRTELFLDRELSLLAFHRRVLALAEDAEVPLLERLRFLTIVSSNLDEFFEIRVAGMRGQIREQMPPPGMSLHELRDSYAKVAAAAHALVADQYRVYNERILPALAGEGIRLVRRIDTNDAQREWVRTFFRQQVRPLLTPIGLDPSHPFPQVVNKSLNFIVELSGSDAFGRATNIAILKAPRVLPRVLELPREIAGPGQAFMLLSSVIHANVAEIFPGREVIGYSRFRVTRDSDLWVDEEEVKNLRQALQGELPHRQFGSAVRLEVDALCPPSLAELLLTQFDLGAGDLYRVDGPVNLVRMAHLADLVDRDELKYPVFFPGLPAELPDYADVLGAVRRQDILLHHPYQSFEPVIEFVRQAAADPQVVAIKQTVYRTGANSELMEALIEAARRGKEVTVVVELMARFDEEANINWAERLEQVGAQVIYGVFGLKTHAKLALVIRREETGGRPVLRMYAHLGTGNYHPRTARFYTDMGLLTAHPEICNDVNEVFLHVTSLARPARLKHLWLAPFTLQRRLLKAIRNEARNAAEGRPAGIVAKMNALVEEAVIKALYAASQAGVQIELIVRGQCALRPGVPGLSENIRVRSILGRFLEHSRIYYFLDGGAEKVYLASADWMGRNLFRRIEVAFPVLDAGLRRRVIDEGLKPCLADNVAAWDLLPDGGYVRRRPKRRATPLEAQRELMLRLGGKAGEDE